MVPAVVPVVDTPPVVDTQRKVDDQKQSVMGVEGKKAFSLHTHIICMHVCVWLGT